MRRNHRYYKPLVLIMIAIMFCSAMALQVGISQVQADSGNLADKAVSFLKTEYETNGAPRGMAGFGPYDACVLKAAGVDVSAWQHNSVALPDAVKDLVQQDISNPSGPVKHLAQDLIAMQKMGENNLANQLQTLISNRQNNDGSFQNDASVYSIIPVYELLGREGKLSIVDSVYAENYILNGQNGSTGAWADFMVTAQAVRALNYLSPGADPNSPVGQAITSGCDWMKQQQLADGSFKAALDDSLIDTAEAIATQKALGLDPAAAWTNSGKSAVDYLNNCALNADGSFGSSRNVMDATWALDSFTRLGIFPTGGGGGGGGPSSEISVQVRVEGITGAPVDSTVSVSGTALDALNQAVGSGNVGLAGSFINSINGEAGNFNANPPTSWFYYAIRNGTIDANSLSSVPGGYNVANGDQIVFYIGAYDANTFAAKTYLPVVSVTPQAPTAGQTVTLSISAKKYDFGSGLQDLSSAETTAIGEYTVQVGGTIYTSSYGQVSIPNVAAGTLSYVITNPSSGSYPDVVPYRGSITVGATVSSSVRVRVEGITGAPVDSTVSVSGTALDALNQAVGSGNVGLAGSFINNINGEAGNFNANPPTSWFYYAIRNGTIDPNSLSSVPGGYNVANGDQIVFYIGAYDANTFAAKTYLPVVSVTPQAPTAGQTVTLSISAKKYDFGSGLQDLSSAETTVIGEYTVQVGGTTYTSINGQVGIPNAASSTLSYAVINQNAVGYPNIVPYRGSICMPGTVTANDTTVPIKTSAAQCDAPITVNIDAGVNNTKIDVAALVSTNGSTDTTQPLPALNINAGVQFQGQNPVTVEISIPAGTTISADSSWDGTIQAPGVVNPATLPSTALPSGVNISSANIIAVGFGDVQLTFSQPVKLVLPGQHGKSVGYIRNNTFTPISTVLSSNTAAALISAGSQDGYYDDGTDISIWTRHFTDYIAYSLSGGTGGGSGSSSCSPGIAVVGMSGEKLFGPTYVTVLSTNKWGVTAMGALEATGLNYTTSSTWNGYVDSIAGQAEDKIRSKGWMYTVNGSKPNTLAKDYPISSTDKVIWYYSNSMDQEPPTWEQLLSGAYGLSGQQAVTSTTGKATVFPAGGGKIGLGDEASIDIPPGALNGTEGLDVSIQKVSSPPLAPQGFRLLSYIFEFTIGGSNSYKFNKPVTLTFSFDLAALPEGQKPSVYYYDASTSKWVDLGGTINGSTITVSVDHFTKFALIIKETDFPLAPPQYSQFVDVPASFWASDAIIKMNRLGYANGYPDGTFKPDNQITRAEFVAILDKLLNLTSYSPTVSDFNDVSFEDWFYHAIENAVHAGIIKGYGSTFNPDRQVTREEVAVILVNALGKQDEAMASMGEKTSFSDDVSISNWARGFVVVAVKHGLIKGYPDGEFKPQGSATRAEACVVITNFLNLNIFTCRHDRQAFGACLS